MNYILLANASLESEIIRFRSISAPVLIAACTSVVLLIWVLFAWMFDLNTYAIHKNLLAFDSFTEEKIVSLIFSPLAHTTIYQYAGVSITLYLSGLIHKREYVWIAILLPAVFFSASAGTDLAGHIRAFLIGLSLNFFYLIMKEKSRYSFLFTVFVYFLFNLVVFSIKHLV